MVLLFSIHFYLGKTEIQGFKVCANSRHKQPIAEPGLKSFDSISEIKK